MAQLLRTSGVVLEAGRFEVPEMDMTDQAPRDLLTALFDPLSPGAAVVRLEGEIDLSSSHVLSEAIDSMLSSDLREVVIDATLQPGALTLAECVIPGATRDEVLRLYVRSHLGQLRLASVTPKSDPRTSDVIISVGLRGGGSSW